MDSPTSAEKSMMRPFLKVSLNLSIMLPLWLKGLVLEIVPSTSVLRGAVNTSSVGRLAKKVLPCSFILSAATQIWPSGNPIVISVPGAI
ncbi:hypothetical protein D3C81_1838630 [compost metagenome]